MAGRARLPAEILEMIFQRLEPSGLKAAVLVCRRWRELAEAPRLWTWVGSLRVTAANLSVMARLLKGRLRVAGRRVEMAAVSEELLEAVADHRGRRELEVSTYNLTALEPSLVAAALVGQETLLLSSDLTHEQATTFFTVLAEGTKGTRLKNLSLSFIPLSSVEPQLLGRALSRLEKVELEEPELSEAQIDAIFVALGGRESSVRSLNLLAINLSAVEPAKIGRVVTKLDTCALRQTDLTQPQVEALFTALEEPSMSKLRKLDLACNDLSLVKPELMARVVNHRQEVELMNTGITDQQYQLIDDSLLFPKYFIGNLRLEVDHDNEEFNKDWLVPIVHNA
jgi:hypothetical protein